MTHPVESFVIALGKASKRSLRHLRGLSPADKDDVIATAIAWCWEHRAEYNPSVALETWTDSAMRDARSKWRKYANRTVGEFNESMAPFLSDDTSRVVEAKDAMRALMRQLTPMQRKAVRAGEPLPAGLRAKYSHLLPEGSSVMRVKRTPPATMSDDLEGRPSQIDKELARLSAPPKGMADCPVCWRCSWHQSIAPRNYRQRVTVPFDKEVQAAIWATEARKIAIAEALQAGTIRFIGPGPVIKEVKRV